MSASPEEALPEPPSLAADAEFPQGAALSPSPWDESRRYPRFHYRARIEATIYPPADAEKEAAPVRCAMMTRDLSRGGINVLHSDQLAVGQKLELVLNGSPRWAEVMWCRRLAHRCFSVGCRFVKGRASGEASDQ